MDYLHQHWLTSHSVSGLIHFTTCCIGLVLGLGILFLHPGSKIHKIAGYVFIPTLLIANFSAFFIHEMGMTFGPFHYLIPFSLFFLFRGIRPFLMPMERVKKLKTHIRGMVGASLGLWAAFCAELVARTPSLNKLLFSFGGNSFWVSTIEGFFFVFLFNRQFKRLGLDKAT
jgi:uncharacterized membrane protein